MRLTVEHTLSSPLHLLLCTHIHTHTRARISALALARAFALAIALPLFLSFSLAFSCAVACSLSLPRACALPLSLSLSLALLLASSRMHTTKEKGKSEADKKALTRLMFRMNVCTCRPDTWGHAILNLEPCIGVSKQVCCWFVGLSACWFVCWLKKLLSASCFP